MRSHIHKRFQKLLSLPEWVLVGKAQQGDKEAFGKLYELYVDKIYRYIFFRIGQERQKAEDITEIVFVRVWEKLDTFKTGNFQAWVYAIARNALIDHYRKDKPEAILHENIAEEKDHEEQVFLSLEIERVMQAMKKLTEEQQEVLTLKFINDMSYKEIAKILGKREDAVRAMQYRALQALREELA